jgi:hypothetical protein
LVEVDEGRELLGRAADDRQHQGEAVRRRPDDRLRRAAHPDPGGQAVLGAGVHLDAVERAPDRALPGDRALLEQPGEQVELLGEQHLVVLEREPEQRERLGEGAAAQGHLGPATRDRVERREPLEHPDRVVRAQHRDRRPEPDPLGLSRDAGQDHVGRADREVGPVVLSHAEEVEAHGVREHALRDHLADRLRLADELPVRAPLEVAERVEPERGRLRRAQQGVVEVHDRPSSLRAG